MQQLSPSEISDLIKSKIEKLQFAAQARTEGTVVTVTDNRAVPVSGKIFYRLRGEIP